MSNNSSSSSSKIKLSDEDINELCYAIEEYKELLNKAEKEINYLNKKIEENNNLKYEVKRIFSLFPSLLFLTLSHFSDFLIFIGIRRNNITIRF